MKYWLLKTEPKNYSIDDLKTDKKTFWSGIRNYQARNFIRDNMEVGDMCIIYHSNADETGAVGLAEVCSKPYHDPTQFDPKSDYFDIKSTKVKLATKPNDLWYCVDIEFKEKLRSIFLLQDMKKNNDLAKMQLLKKGNRLSILPVSSKEFHCIYNNSK